MILRCVTFLLIFLWGFCGLLPSVSLAEMPDYPRVKLRSLDKITARTMTFDARVGSTVKFGPLFIKIQSCRKAEPTEQPESAAFLQIWEVTPEDKAKWIFSGWMFASSPALSPMDHPVYDVWVIDCLGDAVAEEQGEEETEDEDNTATDANTDSEPDTEPEAQAETGSPAAE